jgi:hypothetical protein
MIRRSRLQPLLIGEAYIHGASEGGLCQDKVKANKKSSPCVNCNSPFLCLYES